MRLSLSASDNHFAFGLRFQETCLPPCAAVLHWITHARVTGAFCKQRGVNAELRILDVAVSTYRFFTELVLRRHVRPCAAEAPRRALLHAVSNMSRRPSSEFLAWLFALPAYSESALRRHAQPCSTGAPRHTLLQAASNVSQRQSSEFLT